MTPHDAIRESITDLLAGRLDAGESAEVTSHLASCEECASLVDDLAEVAAGFRAGGLELLSPHPTAAILRRLAIGSTGNAEVAGHVATCASCSLEVEIHRGASRAAQVRRFLDRSRDILAGARSARRGWAMPASLAATFVVGLTLGLVYRPIERFGEDASPASAWSGPVRLVVLEPPLRGTSTVPAFVVPAGQPYVPLATAVALDAGVDDRAALRFELRNSSGHVTWSATIDAAEARSSVRATGVVTLLVPAGLLEPGSYSLSAGLAEGGSHVLDAPFEVRR